MTRSASVIALLVALVQTQPARGQLSAIGLQVWRVRGGLTVIHFYEEQLTRFGMRLTAVEETARTPPFVDTLMDPPFAAFAIEPSSTLEFSAVESIFVRYEAQGQEIRHRGGFTLWLPARGNLPAAALPLRDFVITPADLLDGGYFDSSRDSLYLRDAPQTSPLVFNLKNPMRAFIDLSPASPYAKYSSGPQLTVLATFDDGASLLWLGTADMRIGEAGAEAVGRPDLVGLPVGLVEVYAMVELAGTRTPSDEEIEIIRKAYPRAGSGAGTASPPSGYGSEPPDAGDRTGGTGGDK